MWDNFAYIFYLLMAFVCWKLMFKMPDSVIYYAKFGFYIMCTQIVALVMIPVMVLNPRNVMNGYLIAQILKHTTKVIGVTWELRNGKVVGEDKAAVIIVNHQSSLDILGLYNIRHVALKTAPVCRKELLYLFPFGLAAYLTGCIFIDRKKPKDANDILKAAGDILFKNKTKIWVFPEGTRNDDLAKMRPFKNGAFTLALACQVPIIPLVISPYYFLDSKKRIFNNGHAIIKCLDAVPTEGLTMDDLPELKNKLQNMMECAYEQLGEELANRKIQN